MNQQMLEQKLQSLNSYARLDSAEVQRLGAVLRSLDGWDLFRINPLRFARDRGFDPDTGVELFIHGARVGLFDLSYDLVCPSCAGIARSEERLDAVPPDSFHCVTCNSAVPVELDDRVHVTFTINPSVAPLDLDVYASQEAYRRYFFSSDYELSPAMRDYLAQHHAGFVVVAPDASAELELPLAPGDCYAVFNLMAHSELLVVADAEPPAGPQTADVDLLDRSFAPQELRLPAGRATLRLHNRTRGAVGLLAYAVDEPAFREAASQGGRWQPVLSGKMLLNHQSFRELFRIEQLAPGLRLNVRSLTVLFTDLKNSTQLYGAAGDAFAYSLVREHFDLLAAAVRRHAGSIVKTMGDAVMATFLSPRDGVGAALEMQGQIAALNTRLRRQGYETGIKIGLNEGPVLAVNADQRLDYFGQHVNVAARVQGLAQADEIWLTEPVFASPGVAAQLRRAGYAARPQSALLKGVAEPTLVYQCGPAEAPR